MALTDLLQTLEREATARADTRLAEARAEAERLTAARAAELATHREQALAARERLLRSEGERGVVAATREAERTRLLAQHELLDRVHDRARLNLVQHAGTTRGRAAIAVLLSRARTYLGRRRGHGPGHSAAHRNSRRGTLMTASRWTPPSPACSSACGPAWRWRSCDKRSRCGDGAVGSAKRPCTRPCHAPAVGRNHGRRGGRARPRGHDQPARGCRHRHPGRRQARTAGDRTGHPARRRRRAPAARALVR